MQPKRLTDLGKQTDGWIRGTHEVVSWKSQDGTVIEGVLHKPAGFEAGRRYPLLVVIHGGPTGVSRPTPFSERQLVSDRHLARRRARSCSSRTTAAARATARSSAR